MKHQYKPLMLLSLMFFRVGALFMDGQDIPAMKTENEESRN